MDEGKARTQLMTAMVLFGTIGVFVRGIPLPSGVIAMVRGLAGSAFLLAVARLRGRAVAWRGTAVPWLVLSGAFLGLNWLLLFEAYRYTTVAAATVCYYLAPVLVMLASPFALGERLSAARLACGGAAFAGIVLVSGFTPAGGGGGLRGTALALGAACLYAGLMLVNKRITGISAYDRTAIQLGTAGALLLPFCLRTAGDWQALSPKAGLLLAVVAVVHTGVTYLLYFGSMEHLSAQSVSILSYVDPVVALLCSVTVLGEPLTARTLAGAVLVLGAAWVSEGGFVSKGGGKARFAVDSRDDWH